MFKHKWAEIPRIKQVNTPEGRRYEVGDTQYAYPSITTVLGATADKTWLYEWRARVGEEKANAISQAATRRGTSMHKLCERYLKNEDLAADMPTSEEDKDFAELRSGDWTAGQLLFHGIRPALDRVDNVRALEVGLFSHKLKVAGTVDCIAELDGTLSIIDFKTSKRDKEKSGISDYFMQGAFYFAAYHEITGELPKQISILIAVQGGGFQEFTIKGREIIHWTEQLKKRIEAYYYNVDNTTKD